MMQNCLLLAKAQSPQVAYFRRRCGDRALSDICFANSNGLSLKQFFGSESVRFGLDPVCGSESRPFGVNLQKKIIFSKFLNKILQFTLWIWVRIRIRIIRIRNTALKEKFVQARTGRMLPIARCATKPCYLASVSLSSTTIALLIRYTIHVLNNIRKCLILISSVSDSDPPVFARSGSASLYGRYSDPHDGSCLGPDLYPPKK